MAHSIYTALAAGSRTAGIDPGELHPPHTEGPHAEGPRSDEADVEELEHIPWGMLGADMRGARRYTMASIVLGIVVAATVFVIAMTVLRRTPELTEIAPAEPPVAVALPDNPGDSPSGTGEPTSPAVAVPQEGGVAGESSASPSPAVPSPPGSAPLDGQLGPSSVGAPADLQGPALAAPSPYSEADLMAVLPEQELRAASAAAEWFVAAYFTVDGVEGAELTLPEGLPRPGRIGDSGVAWVERTHTTALVSTESGRYEVTVAFQIMATGPSGGYLRLPLRAVTVPVAMQPGGGVAIADLPSPAETPEVVAMTSPDLGVEQAPPDEVVDQAVREVPWPDAEVDVTATHRTQSGWRVLVQVDDGSGNLVPLVVAVDD